MARSTLKKENAGPEFPAGMPPFQVRYRNVPAAASLEHAIQRKVEDLWKTCPEIMDCQVLVERSSPEQVHGNLFHVRIEAAVPHADPLIVSHHHPRRLALKNARTAVEDAFAAMHRVAAEYRDRLHRDTRPRHHALQGEVSALSPGTDSGRIVTPDGKEIYFHRNSLKHGDYDQLETGSAVSFEEEMGEEGPQAVFVKVERGPGALGRKARARGATFNPPSPRPAPP